MNSIKKNFKPHYDKVKDNTPEIILKHRDLVKFVLVGGSGTVVNMVLLWVFAEIVNLPLQIAGILAIECSIINNFILNNLWTFRKSTNSGSTITRFGKYQVSVLIGIAINYSILLFLSSQGVHYLIANFIGIIMATGSNYMMSKYWAWKND